VALRSSSRRNALLALRRVVEKPDAPGQRDVAEPAGAVLVMSGAISPRPAARRSRRGPVDGHDPDLTGPDPTDADRTGPDLTGPGTTGADPTGPSTTDRTTPGTGAPDTRTPDGGHGSSERRVGIESPVLGSRPWSGVASGRRRELSLVHRPPASEAEPSHRRPDRPALALITTTPDTDGTGATATRPLPPITARRTPPPVAGSPVPTRSLADTPTPRPKAVDAVAPAARPGRSPRRAPRAPAITGPAVPSWSSDVSFDWVPPGHGSAVAEVAAPSIAPAADPARDAGTLRQRPDGFGLGGRRPLTVLQTLVVLVVCIGLWVLVDAPALTHSAETAPLGTRRSAALALLHPIDRLSAALGIDRVSRTVDRLTGQHRVTTARRPVPQVSDAHTAVRPAAGPGRSRPTPAVQPESTPPPAPGTLAAAVPPLRVATPADPLRVLVVGDSLGLSFGQSLATKLDATGVARTTVDAREGTGLARPDAFDWSAQLESDINRVHPEVVVASFGGNDDQDVQVGGRYIAFDSAPWQEIYRTRVVQIADEVHAAGAHLLWSGLPVVRAAGRTGRYTSVMDVTHAALNGLGATLWVDNLATLTDAAGHYQVALPDASGQQVLVREPDGIHETRAGADRLADRSLLMMIGGWHLDLRGVPSPVRTPPAGQQVAPPVVPNPAG